MQSASPDEIAERIIRPLEDSLGTLNNLDRLSATASTGEARLDVMFLDGTDMDLATVEVRDRVDRVRHRLPDDLRNIRIRRFQTSDIPILRFHLATEKVMHRVGAEPWTRDQLYDFAERVLQRRLERLDGVAQVQIRGLRTRQIQIRLDADRMSALGIDVRQLASTLRENHLDMSIGYLDEDQNRFLVRALGRLASLDDIRRLPIERGLHLEDVAEVVYDYPVQDSFNFLNGEESLSVRVYKTSDGNLLEVVERVKAELAALAAEPRFAGHTTRIYGDASNDVRQGLAQLRDAGMIGGLLAVFAVFIFLRRVRTTALVAIAIPVSVVFTFVLMFVLRQIGWSTLTLNVISLMGLVLALGMLVDSSIVVIESIYRRLETFGEDAKTAALRGTSDVALPIVASTATTLCVFVPIIFVRSSGGFFARYLVEIGTTICIVMVASLLVALTVVPMVAAMVLTHERPTSSRFLRRLENGYTAVLRLTLRFRLVFLLLAIAMLWGSWQLFGSIERSFGGRTQERQVSINADTPMNYSEAQTRVLFEELFAILDTKRDELDIADMTWSYTLGSGRSRGRGQERSLELYLVDEAESQLSTTEVRDRVRALMPTKAGVELSIGQAQHRHGGGGIEIELSGDDPAVLELLGREIAGDMALIAGLDDVDLSLESGDEELRVEVDRARAVAAGLSTQGIASTIQNALSERALSYVSADDREVDITMLLRDDEEATRGELENLGVAALGSDGEVPLSTLATFTSVSGPRSIERENRQSKIRITANGDDPMAMGTAMREIRGLLGGLPMPPGYSWSFGANPRWRMLRALPPGLLGKYPGHVHGSLKAIAIQIGAISTPERRGSSTAQIPIWAWRGAISNDRAAALAAAGRACRARRSARLSASPPPAA